MVAHRDKQVLRMQHFVVLQVVQQGVGHGAHFGSEEHGCALHPCRR